MNGDSMKQTWLRAIAVAIIATASLVLGIWITTQTNTPMLPLVCHDALTAADTIADAIEAQWATASEEVTRVQEALADTDYRNRAHQCLITTSTGQMR